MAIEETLDLDIASALRGVGRVGDALDRAVAEFRRDLDRAITTAGNRADLNLDVDAAALQRSISQAVSRSGGLTVTVDEQQLTRDINQAIARADTSLVLRVDASAITAGVNAAIARANNNVTVTASAASVTAAVNAAIAAANNNVTINGSANISGVEEAGEGFTFLGNSIKTATAALGAYVGVQGVERIIGAASDLEEAQTKVQAVFKDSAADAFAFAEGTAERIGFAESAALEALGTFGNFLTSSGLATDQALEYSTALTTLAGDLASFNNIAIDDAFVKLRAGLAGEIEPLRAIGISVTEVEVKARALELGLVNLGEEVSQQARLQARYSLIMEKSANAQGDFARTADNLANQQRILKAQFEDVLTTVGAPLVSPLLSILQTAVPLAGEAADAFGRIVGVVLPALEALLTGAAPAVEGLLEGIADAAEAAGPGLEDLGESAGEIIGALLPLVEVVALLIGGLGESVSIVGDFVDGNGFLIVALTVLTAGLIAGTIALGGLGGAAAIAAGEILFLFGAIAANPVGAAIVALTLLAAALGAFSAASEDAVSIQDRVADRVEGLASAFGAGATSVGALADSVARLTEEYTENFRTASSFADDDAVLESFDRIGISVDRTAELLSGANDGFREFTATAAESGEVVIEQTRIERGWQKQVELTAEEIRNLDGDVGALLASGELRVTQGEDLIAAANAEAIALEQVRRQAVGTAIDMGALSQEQVDFALALAAGSGATDTWGTAIQLLDENLGQLNSQLDATSVPLGQQTGAWVELARQIADGTLATQDYQFAADALGTDLETVSGFADGVREAIAAAVDTAVSALPTAADALTTFRERFNEEQQRIAEDAREAFLASLPEEERANAEFKLEIQSLDEALALGPGALQGLVTEFANTGTAIDTFNTNLAGIPAEAQRTFDFLAEQGPVAAGGVAEALNRFPELVGPFEAELARIEQETAETAQLVGDRATDSLTETGILAAELTAEFGTNLNFSEVTADELDASARELRNAITNPSSGPAADARAAGELVGSNYADGLVEGIESRELATFAGKNTEEWVEEVRRILQEQSPSKVAIGIGENFSEGLVIGMGELLRTNAAADIGAQVARAVNTGLDQPRITPGALAPATGSSFDNSRTSISVPVSVSGVGAAEARQVGAMVGAEVADVLAEVFAL